MEDPGLPATTAGRREPSSASQDELATSERLMRRSRARGGRIRDLATNPQETTPANNAVDYPRGRLGQNSAERRGGHGHRRRARTNKELVIIPF